MWDIFDDPTHPSDSPISAAASSLARCAGRLVQSLIYSVQYLPSSVAEKFFALLNYQNLWALAIVLGGWVFATIVGGPIGLAVNGLLLVYGLYSLYEQLAATWNSFRQAATTAYNARSDEELHEAGRFFADALSQGGITLIEVVVTHRVFTKIEGSLRKKFPTPEWVKSEFERARRMAKEANEEPSPTKKLTELGEDLAKDLTDASRARGLEKLPQAEFPVGLAIAGALVATAATTAVVLSLKGKS